MASTHTPLGLTPDVVEFIIKNPTGANSLTFTLRATSASTVLDLKKQLQTQYPGNPDSQSQTIIYAGKVLREDDLCVKDFLRPKLEESIAHSLHLVIKDSKSQAHQAPHPPTHFSTSAGPSGYNPPAFQPRPTPPGAQTHTAQAQNAQPQNAAMLAAYQAALNTFVNNRQPQQAAPQGSQQASSSAQNGAHPGLAAQPQPVQGQQPSHGNAAAQDQGAMYPVHAPPMLAYIPVLVPNPYAAMPHAWPQPQQQQQQHQAQQQQSMAGHGQPVMQYPYPPFTPMWLPYGMPPPGQGMPPGPFRMHVAGPHHPGAPRPPPNAAWRVGPRQRHAGQIPAGGVPGVADGMPANILRARRGAGLHVRLVRIDLKALVQLAVVGLVLYQHCPPGRFLMLMGVGALLYLTGLGPLQRALQRLVALALPAPMRTPQAGGQGAPVGPPPAAPQWTLFGELQAVVVGFFSSLIPGWNMNAEDAAAFAAAQQMQAAEAARDQRAAGAGGQNNLHQD
ncbi:hypothetical protein ABBQ38_004745 [Trebouxia sp. C0009 RCD-2024]